MKYSIFSEWPNGRCWVFNFQQFSFLPKLHNLQIILLGKYSFIRRSNFLFTLPGLIGVLCKIEHIYRLIQNGRSKMVGSSSSNFSNKWRLFNITVIVKDERRMLTTRRKFTLHKINPNFPNVIGLRTSNTSESFENTVRLTLFYANRPFARWRHFTTTTRIFSFFSFVFKFGILSEVWVK